MRQVFANRALGTFTNTGAVRVFVAGPILPQAHGVNSEVIAQVIQPADGLNAKQEPVMIASVIGAALVLVKQFVPLDPQVEDALMVLAVAVGGFILRRYVWAQGSVDAHVAAALATTPRAKKRGRA